MIWYEIGPSCVADPTDEEYESLRIDERYDDNGDMKDALLPPHGRHGQIQAGEHAI